MASNTLKRRRSRLSLPSGPRGRSIEVEFMPPPPRRPRTRDGARDQDGTGPAGTRTDDDSASPESAPGNTRDDEYIYPDTGGVDDDDDDDMHVAVGQPAGPIQGRAAEEAARQEELARVLAESRRDARSNENASSGGAAEASASQGSSSSRGASGEHVSTAFFDKVPARHGLTNGGSTCWLNTLIQVASSPRTTLGRMLMELSRCDWDDAMKEGLSALWQMVDATGKVTSAEPDTPSIHAGFVGANGVLKPAGFNDWKQQDIGEAFVKIWELLQSQATATGTPLPPPLTATTMKTSTNAQCSSCGLVHSVGDGSLETHLMLALPDDSSDSAITLQGLLDDSTAPREMSDSHCTSCTQLTSSQQVTFVNKAPATLVVIVNRTGWIDGAGGYGSKDNRTVQFDQTASLLVRSASGTTQRQVYDVRGIGVHIGPSLNAGHYKAFVAGRSDTWVCADDADTTEVSWSDVSKVNPTIMVLERSRGGGAAATHGTDVTAFWSAAVAAARGQASGPAGQAAPGGVSGDGSGETDRDSSGGSSSSSNGAEDSDSGCLNGDDAFEMSDSDGDEGWVPSAKNPARQVPAIDEASQPPTTSAAAVAAAAPTLRRRTTNPETQVASSKRGSDGTGGPSPAQTRSPPTGGDSRGVYDLSPADARTKIRDALPEELRDKWTRSVSGPSWRNTPRRVTEADLRRHDQISRLKAEVTTRGVPDVAAVVGKRPLQEGVVVWPLAAKSLNFPVNDDHLMGGPVKYEGINGAKAWRNNVRWLDLDGNPLPDQCATAHYVYEVVDRCALDGVLIVDASGVGHPRGGSGLVRGDADTKRLMKRHIRCLLEGGARTIEVHSASATEHFIDALEEMAAGGSHDLRVPFGSSNVRAHVFFDVPCGGDQGSDAVVVIGTNHHCMMRTPLNAARIVRHQIFASALGGRQLDTEHVAGLWGMVAGATMTNEEWTENYATLIEELNPEERATFERFQEKHAGDMNSAWASLVAHRGGEASIKKRRKDPQKFKDDCAAGGEADYAEGAALPGGGTSKGTRKRKAAGGEDGTTKGTEGGTCSGFSGKGKKNAKFTLKHATRVRKGLDPGFTHARCSQGAGKECGRCMRIEKWDGLAIPDLRPGAAQDAWVAVLRSHAIRRGVPGGGNKVVTLHKGAMSPWKGDAATGQSLKGAEGVEYLSERRAAVIVAKHEDLYREWSKNNPDNN